MEDELQGDLLEMYAYWVNTVGVPRARWRYALAVLRLIRPFSWPRTHPRPTQSHPNYTSHSGVPGKLRTTFFLHPAMLRNYLTLAFRNLFKNKISSGINITGLALGIATFLFILEYISFERSINQFHRNLPTLYRVLIQDRSRFSTDLIPPGLAPLLKQQFGEIASYCRTSGGIIHGIVTTGDPKNGKSFREGDQVMTMVDRSFFELFSFPILAGSKQPLDQPFTVAISESYAKKYFGNQSPVGQLLTLNNQFGKGVYKVTAMYQDFPAQSDIQYHLLFSLRTLSIEANLNGNGWAKLDNLDNNFSTAFVQLAPKADHHALEAKIEAYKNQLKPEAADARIQLQPLRYVHLAASLSDPSTTTGNLKFIYVLGSLALLILAIAWFNYINLSTASSLKRAKEVGVRKVIGAGRSQLIHQFFGEYLLLNGLSIVLALFVVIGCQHFFNQLIGKPLSLSIIPKSGLWGFGLLALSIGSVASGGYVAFSLSGFQPIQTLKGVFARTGRGLWVRRALVVFQFSISIALIAATVVFYRQLHYMQHKELGMNLAQLLVIRGPEVNRDSSFSQRTTAFQQQLQQLSFVEQFCTSSSIPGQWYNFKAAGITRPNPKPNDDKKSYAIASVDHRFVPTYGMTMKEGRNITAAMCTKSWNQVSQLMLNETAVQQLGFSSAKEAVGQRVQWGTQRYEVTGVVKDYHHQSVQQAIDPIIFIPQLSDYYSTVRLTSDRMGDKLKQLEALYQHQFPGNPFDFFFVDENYNRQYETEQKVRTLFSIASGLAILIACLGLFGLAAFTVEQRTKEIGIRKVLGASMPSLLGLISTDFIKLVLLAIVIGTPMAWYAASRWLADFAYKIELSWWIFAGSGLLAVAIALVTISLQSLKAAWVNPVKALRTD
ncbi:ABC transporter permease [Larkinella knui]